MVSGFPLLMTDESVTLEYPFVPRRPQMSVTSTVDTMASPIPDREVTAQRLLKT